MKLRNIGVEDGDDFIFARDHLGGKTVSNHLTLLATMLRLATTFKVPWLYLVPKFNKPKVALFGTDYRYLRSDEEIRRFLAAAKEEDEHVFVLYAVAIYTGMRAGELAAFEWGDVDFDQRRITVQRSFEGPTKSNKVRYVPIFDVLLPILRAWRLRHPGRLVFTNRDGSMFGESARVFQEVLHRCLDRADFPKTEAPNGKVRRYIVFHGLRHTFASAWIWRGGDIFKLQRLLGHANLTMTMRYAHLAPDAFSADYARFGPVVAVGAAPVLPISNATG